jgi:hypothetical protein
MGEKMAERILPKVATSTSLLCSFTCRKARHGTDGFTSSPKEGVLIVMLLTEYYSSNTSEIFLRLWPFLDPLRPSEDLCFLLCISLCGVQGLTISASTPISFFLFACKQLQNQYVKDRKEKNIKQSTLWQAQL